MHAWNERGNSRGEAKLKKNNFPFYAFQVVGLDTQISILQGVHIGVPTHNCKILSKSGVHSLGYAPSIPPPQTPTIHHSSCLPNTQTFFFLSSPSQYQSTSSLTDLLSNFSTHFPKYTLLAILSVSILSTRPLPSSSHTTILSVHFALYPFF